MTNNIARSYAGLKAQAQRATEGLAQHGAALSLTHSTAAIMTAKVEALDLADTNYKRGKTDLVTRKTSQASLVQDARAFSTKARDVLKTYNGNVAAPVWEEAGFYQSLGVPLPYQLAKLVQLQLDLKNYFTAHPTYANAALNVTAEQAETLHADLGGAVGAVAAQKATNRGLHNLRGTRMQELDLALRNLLKELKVALDPMDARWLAFGFNRPGAPETPEVPTNVIAVLIGSTSASVKWNASARAKYYRVWIRTAVDQPWVSVGNPADLDFTVEELLRNKKTEVAVSAVNDGGESALSSITSVTTLP